jgi:hypothetical protein
MTTQPEEDPARAGRRPVIAVFTSHWLAMTGLTLLLTSIVLWVCLIPVQLRHGNENPYIGLATMLVGGMFAVGLVLTPVGLHLGRRRVEQRLAAQIGDRSRAWRRFLVFLAFVSLLNLAIASQLTFRAVHSMESRQFCSSCHVMTPEARAFEIGPHASLLCVDCHVGNGALGFVKSKLQGTKQLWRVITDTVPKPIEGAISAGLMIPSAETCEECHWKQQPAKATLRLFQGFAEDEANTVTTTLLTMNVGGAETGGIHGTHNGDGVEIRFVASDETRNEIPLVEYRNAKTGVERTFVMAGVDPKTLDGKPRITMQCFDCHNRPAHAFQLPDRAVDRALMLGRMPSSLPWVKKASMEVLKAEYPSSEAAATAIPKAFADWYAKSYSEIATTRAADVERAGRVLADIYSRNVFPELGVKWGTHPNFLGHSDEALGCFRCHDGDHVASDGEKIKNDCFRCHFPSAVDEEKPEVLKLLGLDKQLRDLQKPR